MPRNMSVALTASQVRNRAKTVTRRLGQWHTLVKPGDQLTLCPKTRGLKPGEQLDRIVTVTVTSVRREPLNAITAEDVTAEGFPGREPAWFVAWFCDTHGCLPGITVTRIEWRYPDAPAAGPQAGEQPGTAAPAGTGECR